MGMEQNETKAEHQVWAVGRGAVRRTKQFADEVAQSGLGTAKRVTRYLGNYLDVVGCTKYQVDHRCAAFMTAYYSMGGFWRDEGVPLRWRLSLFKGFCLSTLLAGMECETLTGSDLLRMDVLVLGRLRKLLGGTTRLL